MLQWVPQSWRSSVILNEGWIPAGRLQLLLNLVLLAAEMVIHESNLA